MVDQIAVKHHHADRSRNGRAGHHEVEGELAAGGVIVWTLAPYSL